MVIVDELMKSLRVRPEKLKAAKRAGVKVVGYTGRFVPEELIRAAGAIPHFLCRGGEPEAPEAVLPYILRFMSPFSRAQIGYHLLGLDPIMPILDIIIAQCDDCHMSRLADLLEYFKLPTYRIGVPPDWDKQLSYDYYERALEKTRVKLEELTARPISEEGLRAATTWLNSVRERLRKIDHLRTRDTPPLGGYDYIRLQHYAFYGDTDGMLATLDHFYESASAAKSHFAFNAPRILLAGHVIAFGDYLIPRLIEEAGGLIVAEFFDEGCWHEYRDVSVEGDIMKNLSRTYFRERIPPSGFQPCWEQRWEYLKKIIMENRVDGVVWYQLSFEEIYDMECSVVSKRIAALDVPFLKLESSYEYAREAMAPLITRIESFVKSIERRKK